MKKAGVAAGWTVACWLVGIITLRAQAAAEGEILLREDAASLFADSMGIPLPELWQGMMAIWVAGSLILCSILAIICQKTENDGDYMNYL